MIQTPTIATLVRADDEQAHIEDIELWTVIRDNHFIELTWNQLTESETYRLYIALSALFTTA